ncbi:MAG: hypothetical protein ACM3PZ_02290 [Bacillota bacterium]
MIEPANTQFDERQYDLVDIINGFYEVRFQEGLRLSDDTDPMDLDIYF